MEMDGWNWEDAAHSIDIGIHLRWPSRTNRQLDYSTFTYVQSPNKEYENQVNAVKEFLTEAAAYASLAGREPNLKFSAMEGLYKGTTTLFVHAGTPKEIVESVRAAQASGIKRITLISADAALWVAEFLKDNKIPVILPTTTAVPARIDDDIDLPYKLPYLLTQAGVTVCLSTEGMLQDGRNLGFKAGIAAGYGLDKEEALKTITSNVALALGIDRRVGTLEAGKDATLFVSEGDALDCRTNIVTHAFISGKNITLPGAQQERYERFSKKYGQTGK
jgi:imidazolonepropionase-like amidohydrolase